MDDLIGKKGRQHDTLIVRGYAGTGKTTAISTLVSVIPLFNKKTMLLAPTGRAAKVLASYSGKKAYTIHKIIYKKVTDSKTGEVRFVKQRNYSANTIFIVDESSMISDETSFLNNTGLLEDLIEYVFQHRSNKLILVGDNAQLPPVGSDRSPALNMMYLKDRYGLDAREVALEEVLRQEENSGILHNATTLRLALFSEKNRPKLMTNGYGDIFRMTHERLEDGLRYAYDKYGIEETAIICRSNWQAVHYNEYIRRNILFREEEIEAGDMVMVVKNNYFMLEPDSPAGFIANGEFAEVRKIFDFEEEYGFRFADIEIQLIDYPDLAPFRAKVILDTLHSNTPSLSQEENNKLYQQIVEKHRGVGSRRKFKAAVQNDEYLNALQIKFAYALTCHKSQGGQWKVVFVDHGRLRDDHDTAEQLRWLYTAITRAEREVYLINFDRRYFAGS